MRDRAAVVYASRWVLDNGTTGTTLHVLSEDVLRPDSVGRPVAKLSGPVSVFDQLVDVPGEYDLELTMTVRDGRGALSVQHAAFAGPIELSAGTDSSS